MLGFMVASAVLSMWISNVAPLRVDSVQDLALISILVVGLFIDEIAPLKLVEPPTEPRSSPAGLA